MTLQLFCRRGESAASTTKKQQEAAGAISIMASEVRKRRTQIISAGAARAQDTLTEEQREAAEPLLSWHAESAGGEQPAGAARA